MNTLESLSDYIILSYKNDLLNIMKSNDKYGHFPLVINFIKLFEILPDYSQNLLTSPSQALISFEQAVLKSQENLVQLYEDIDLSTKPNVHIRISGLPACPELNRRTFPRNQDVGCFLKINGTVIRTTSIKMLEYRSVYICLKCGYHNEIFTDHKQNFSPINPEKCKNPERCNGTKFSKSDSINRNDYKDYQEIKLQQHLTNITTGSIPSSMWVTLEDDLVDSCKPGDDVGICGIVMRRWKTRTLGKRTYVEIVLHANYIQVCNLRRAITDFDVEPRLQFDQFWQEHKINPMRGKNIILESFCPQICGMYLVKLAITLILAGGSRSESSSSRSEPHLLLVGDSGTGKSHLLRTASKILPRSVLTTGIGSTAAGLTVSAVMDDGEWQLEAGALVLADGGICCIDEFDSMKKHDRVSILEAMEQQTISVAKAAMVCKLNTKCSVLAATNPKLPIDSQRPLCESIAIASPLLSRFDLVLILKDQCNLDWDQEISERILTQGNFTETWTLDTIQAYFDVIRTLEPTLTSNADKVLRAYYRYQRCKSQDASRITVRLLDSLIRLSQAHAKLMYRTEVTVSDALVAVSLIETSLDSDALRSDFPADTIINSLELMRSLLQNDEVISLIDEEILLINHISNSENENKLVSLNTMNDDATKKMIQSINIHQNSYINQAEENPFERYKFIKNKSMPTKSVPNYENINLNECIEDSTCLLQISQNDVQTVDTEQFLLEKTNSDDYSNISTKEKLIITKQDDVNRCHITSPKKIQTFDLKEKHNPFKCCKKFDSKSFREKFKFQHRSEENASEEFSKNEKNNQKTLNQCNKENKKNSNDVYSQNPLSQSVNIFDSQENIDDIDLNL